MSKIPSRRLAHPPDEKHRQDPLKGMETQINPMDDGFISAKFEAFHKHKKEEKLNSKKKQKIVYTKEQNKLEVKYHTINISTLTPKEV